MEENAPLVADAPASDVKPEAKDAEAEAAADSLADKVAEASVA